MAYTLTVTKQTTTDTLVTTSVTDYAGCCEEVQIETNRYDSAGKMTFTTVEESGVALEMGDAVTFTADGVTMFKGYVFSAERTMDGEVSYTAYDQLRYLKANASYTFVNMTLAQIIQQIAADFGLSVGTLVETGYIFPSLIKENESCLDIIFDALTTTIIQTGVIYVFYDYNGALMLTEVKDRYINTLLGDSSLVTDYTYKRDIDSDSYNRVKLVRPNGETGKADTYIYEDTETIGKWGLLQYYDEVDESLNAAQIDEMCKNYLTYYNRVLQTITIDAIGVAQLSAGMIIPVQIAAINDLAINRLLLTEKVTHKFDGDDHTMSIEVKNFTQIGGVSIV